MNKEKNKTNRILIIVSAVAVIVIVVLAVVLFVRDAKIKKEKPEITTEDTSIVGELTSQAEPETELSSETETESECIKPEETQLLNASTIGENDNISYGIDVSKYQGTIDWAKVAADGIEFAMIRVGYRDSSGTVGADPTAKYNLQEAEKNGVKIGVYFFSTAATLEEAREDADWVADFIAGYAITYPVVFDCEGFEKETSRQYHLTNEERSNIAMAFMDRVYERGYTPMIYSTVNELSLDAKWDTSRIEKKYKVWIALYNLYTTELENKPPYEGQCSMWQYSNTGRVAGIGAQVDLDVAYFGFDGTEKPKDSSVREEVEIDYDALMKFVEVNETVTAKNEVNLRKKPSQNADSEIVYTLKNGETVTRTGMCPEGWSKIIYNGITCYAVTSYLTTDLTAAPQIQQEEDNGFKTKFTPCNEKIAPKEKVNLRNKPSVTDADSVVVVTLEAGDVAVRTGINTDVGWSRIEYNGQVLYCVSSYIYVVE